MTSLDLNVDNLNLMKISCMWVRHVAQGSRDGFLCLQRPLSDPLHQALSNIHERRRISFIRVSWVGLLSRMKVIFVQPLGAQGNAAVCQEEGGLRSLGLGWSVQAY